MVQLKLESLREQMNKNLQEGNMEEATKLRNELEQLCEQSGFEFQKLDWMKEKTNFKKRSLICGR